MKQEELLVEANKTRNEILENLTKTYDDYANYGEQMVVKLSGAPMPFEDKKQLNSRMALHDVSSKLDLIVVMLEHAPTWSNEMEEAATNALLRLVNSSAEIINHLEMQIEMAKSIIDDAPDHVDPFTHAKARMNGMN